MLTAIALPFYAFFSLYAEGFLNGYQKLKKQAIASTLLHISKVITITILLLMGLKIKGVIFGYAAAALTGFIAAYFYFKKIKIQGEKPFPTKNLIQFTIPIILY